MADLLPDPFPGPDPARFPNTRRRFSASASGIPVPTSSRTTDMPADPDTCRICRGEGSALEPLFYPCKCSGSIKFVHQDCLMEWLSHSQKKHCELCKTPFRFTKLYDPNMPTALPPLVFVSHTAKYVVRNLLVWMRAGLVATVWLGGLPYMMRSVWSFLFWISDEGLGGRSVLFSMLNGTGDGVDLLAGANVCPSSPLFAATTTVATIGGVIDNLPPESAKIFRSLYGINFTSSDPIYSTVLRLLFGTVGLSERPATIPNATASAAVTNHQSLLSGVGFLRNLTRHASINRIIIAVLEGQIITILVIVCFILIILVRDYVVQQQPEINMRAAFAAVDNAPAAPAAPAPAAPAEEPEPEPEHFIGPEEDFAHPPETDSLPDLEEVPEEEPQPFPRLHREASDLSFAESSTGRPLAPIFESGRAVPDQADMHDFERTSVHEYLGIYREAGGDPERILKIAKERHLEDKLDYWIRLTRSMVDRGAREDSGSHAGPSAEAPGTPRQEPTAVTFEDFRALSREGPQAPNGDPKGKGRLTEDFEELESENYAASSSRPRANTDGPQINDTINPLANNNWSFSDLPPPPISRTSSSDRLSQDMPNPMPWADEAESAETLPVQGPENEPEEIRPEPRREPQGLVDRVTDFMWHKVDEINPDELAVVDFFGNFVNNDPPELDEEALEELEREQQAADAAAPPGLDPEAIEDAEDLEGILELLGMRGPVAGLFQNAIFCAFLVSITIFVGVFLPYNMGRIAVWTVANPVRPARMLFSLSKFVQDCGLVVLGLASTTLSEVLHVLSRIFMVKPAAEYTLKTATASWAMAVSAANRIGGSFFTELPIISTSEMRNFSAISHEALLAIKEHIVSGLSALWQLFAYLLGGDYSVKGPEALAVAANVSAIAWEGLKEVPTVVANPSTWVLNLSTSETTATFKPELAYWDGTDRFWAILAGYLTLSLMAGIYLRRGSLFSTRQAAQEWEASIIDGLNQASGVMKVILIIGIEMLVFPLYCGMLLDVALLPLFENATLKSRAVFAVNYPVTSIFVHWFVGTGYMFHFALFVSMCRKIMRKGVLYFIRDPDDPEFHPVRDVLERNVTTQLRKILFSAFVYGALVLVCLGGVVWGLFWSLPRVLPIHYSSNEPVLEFPIDLLFYNFLMPMAVRFFRPSKGLHAMYTWWFRRCARALRITWFLFGERRVDEEGRLALKEDSPDRNLPVWRRLFLEVDPRGEVIARTWHDFFEGGTAKPSPAITNDQMMLLNLRKSSLVQSGQLIPDGRFVRTPASDQVKIPKGRSVFLDVTEDNMRTDRADTDIYSTNQYQFVYVPPHFRARVFFFILFIWIFAAVTGVSITIVPLVFGRWMFKQLIPHHIRTNDIYAFSIGVYILGSAAYALFHARSVYRAVKARVTAAVGRDALVRVFDVVVRTARLVYGYFFVLVIFPLLVASLMELYALIPIHELMYSALLKDKKPASGAELNPAHTVRVIQAWTIGLLYLKLGLRILLTWFEGTHLATAARAVPRRGWLDLDIGILNRAFIVPGLAIWLIAVAAPLLLAKFTVANGLAAAMVQSTGGAADPGLYDAYMVLIYRLSFPFMALGVVSVIALWSVVGVFRSWQVRIRDEAYLIGERLHNFGATAAAPRPRGAWRAGRI